MNSTQLPPTAFSGPFGQADAYGADLSNYIDISECPSYSAQRIKPDDLSMRVLVGRKGSGKTLYLSRMEARSIQSSERIAIPILVDHPSTSLIANIAEMVSDAVAAEVWMMIWKSSIITSLASHCLYNDGLGSYVNADDERMIRESLGDLGLHIRNPTTVYAEFQDLCSRFGEYEALRLHLSSRIWGELEYVLQSILRACPPVCVYIDTIDEEFALAPNYWLRCQAGLFFAVMRLVRDPRYNRLHVVVSIRDVVFSWLLRSEHSTRYLGDPHIKLLIWDHRSIASFFAEKIRSVYPDRVFRRGSSESVIHGWIGHEDVVNERRNLVEVAWSYLLRHTRLIPRDVVLLGNLLCEAGGFNTQSRLTLSADALRQSVSLLSREVGREQLQICASQLASEVRPRGRLYSDGRSSAESPTDVASNSLVAALGHLGVDSLSKSQVEYLEEEVSKAMRQEVSTLRALWQNGLIGVRDSETSKGAHFYNLELGQFELDPPPSDRYVLHPCLIEGAGLRSSQGPPVVPWSVNNA